MRDLAIWLTWAQDEKEQNFFFLCDIHKSMILRKQDGVSVTQMAKTMKCDYPQCKQLSEWEYFPNLFSRYKQYGRQTNKKVHNKLPKKNLEMVKRTSRGSKCKSKKK